MHSLLTLLSGMPLGADADPGGISGWAIRIMETLGAPGAGLAVALENLFPPIPSEVILPLAGFTASQGDMSLAAAIDRTEAWFQRHGRKTVFFGRMIPLFRSFVSIPAGIERMPMATFLLFTTLGSLIWNSVFVVAGYVLGENRQVIEDYAGTYKNAVLAAGFLGVAAFVVVRVLAARRSRQRA